MGGSKDIKLFCQSRLNMGMRFILLKVIKCQHVFCILTFINSIKRYISSLQCYSVLSDILVKSELHTV